MSRASRAVIVVLFVAAFCRPAVAQTCTPVSTSPGALDACFGVNGYVETDVTGTGDFQGVQAVRVQSDGKIVVGGYSRVLGSTGTELFLARYVPDGSVLDLTFGGTGIVKTRLTTIATDSEILKNLAIQPDGKIVAAAQMPPTSKKGSETFAVLRYNVDGTLDGSFGSGGLVTFGFASGADAYARTIAVDGSGRIVVAGESGSLLAVARLLPSGGLDSTFGSGGKATFLAISRASTYGMAIDQSSRPILVGGLDALAYIARLTTTGTLDTSFAGKGWTTFAATNNTNYFTAISIDSLQRICRRRARRHGRRAQGPVLHRYAACPVPPEWDARHDLRHRRQGRAGHQRHVRRHSWSGDRDRWSCHRLRRGDRDRLHQFRHSRVAIQRDWRARHRLRNEWVHVHELSVRLRVPYGLAVQNDNGVMKAVVVEGLNQSRLVGLTRYFW